MALKVLCLVDKEGTALDRLGKGVIKYHDNLDYVVLAVHPKRPDALQLSRLESELQTTDIIDAQYYRTIEKVRELYPEAKKIPTILTHNNPYSITEKDWNDYSLVVGNNMYIFDELKKITDKPVRYIPLTLDTDYWQFNRDWKPNNRVLMVANRIESKKGIYEVAKACAELELKFVLVGNISDTEYMQRVMATGNVEFHENISDDELRELYYGAGLHVCNSIDNFESGTLPILEAMLCGTPVLTRLVGHVPDLYNKTNQAILNGESENLKYIRDRIFAVLSDKKKLEEQRRSAWETARIRSNERRAFEYQKLYREVMSAQTPVSVILPVYDKPETTRLCLDGIAKQDYKNIELIICNDNPDPEEAKLNRQLYEDFRGFVDIPIRYIDQPNLTYGLAKQRNLAVIEATGQILVFCDQRIVMESSAITELVKQLKENIWVFGDKNGKQTFVENFSAVYRKDLVKLGGFNERLEWWGGMSQDIRSRLQLNGMTTQYVPGAKAKALGKSRNKWIKQEDIIKAKNLLFKLGL